jgi:hypothetical protein
MELPTTEDTMDNETYPGTDLLIRTCYAADCQKRIETIDDMWVDVDSNCVVCTECKDKSRDQYDDDYSFIVSIVPASDFLEGHAYDSINEMDQG